MEEPIRHYINIRLLRKGDNLKTSFGPGTACLLKGIEETGSINKATKAMGMAYSKAWRVLGAAEKQLGFALIERKVPDGSVLTEQGRQFLSLYEQMQLAAQQAVRDVLDKSDYKF
ncbi:MAG TPA: LysR family transcriptional regulator [Anaerovoracaceae bacterium]|nr:LysR family transcriptional regulator [Anaerovoracaceae bacterium]